MKTKEVKQKIMFHNEKKLAKQLIGATVFYNEKKIGVIESIEGCKGTMIINDSEILKKIKNPFKEVSIGFKPERNY